MTSHKRTHSTEVRQPDSRVVPPRMRYAVLERDNFRCRACGRTSAETRLDVDHILPVIAGGQTVMENLQALCGDCNSGKSGTVPVAFTPQAIIPPPATVDASALNLMPNVWPPVVVYQGMAYTRKPRRKRIPAGVDKVIYRNAYGAALEVLND